MPRIQGTSNAQSKFLRSFIKNPNGPREWPAPAVFRRWLRAPGFVTAMKSLQHAVRFQADFQLTISAAQAAGDVERTLLEVAPEHGGDKARRITAMSQVMKLAHYRERYAPPEPKTQITESMLLHLMRGRYRDATVADVLDRVDGLENSFRVERVANELWERNREMYRTTGRSV